MSTQQTQNPFSVIKSSHLPLFTQINSSEHGHSSCRPPVSFRETWGNVIVPGPRKCMVAPSAMTIQVGDFTGFIQVRLNHIISASGMLRCSTDRPQATGNSPPRSSEELTTPQNTNPFHPAPALARTVHRTALPTRLGHSGQAPLAAPRQSMPTHRLAWGQQAACPLGGQEHIHLSRDSAPAPQSQLRALQHPTVHCAPGRGLNWHLDSWSHPLCKQQALLLLALMP